MTEPQPPSDTHHPNGTTTTTTTTLTTVPPPQTTTTPSDPPPPTKRQRRPSVRLGEIGDQLFENPNTNTNNKRSINNQKYKHPLSKDSKPTSKSIKSLNLGGPHNINNFSDSGWKVKWKNSKRVRSNWGAINDDDVGMDDYDDVDRYSDQSLNVSRGEGGEFRVSSGPSDNAGEMERNGVRVWLNQIGLGRYYSVFEVHEVDDEVLPLLTLEDLKDMGINAVGSRRKMFCSIQKLGKGFS